MPYSKTTWIDNSSPDIDAANLNNLENGVAAAPHGPDATNHELPVWNGTNWTYQLLTDANIDPAAAITYAKLNLAASVADADISTSANLHKLAAVTGTPDGTKFLRDDGSWQTIASAPTQITGSISSTGGINAGTGFTVNKTGTGTYVITFTTPFASTPTILTTAMDSGSAAPNNASLSSPAATGFTAILRISGASTLADASFDFVAFTTA